MKNFKAYLSLSAVILAGLGFISCKKDRSDIKTDLLYDITVNGATATFTVKTAGVTNYQWDFGDGQTSTDASPTHTYPGKGKYVPTLIAVVDGKKTEASAVLRISKLSPVKIDDQSLDDWAGVTKDVIPLGPKKGVFNNVKLDYDGNYIYLYGEMTGKRSDAVIFDIYLDSDNNPATGLLTGTFIGGGYDILLEGPVLSQDLGIFYYNSTNQNDFSAFTPQSITEAYNLGTVKEEGGVVRFEVRFARGKLKGLTGSGLRIALQAIKNDWSATLGNAPDEGTSSFFFDMSE
ncbi:PKD domain-containing protein [Pedobacter westerhofensis]|uniref:PKD domain-containing protein n=1 Tax=Pedobacter westerhofensis TaxID=425512 RepID=A0A521D2T7_9SPHI|nr:PKD domain-containing protein [Pedobacter westerhofensis]SMO65962.1 PKD domain-containing protein [Pedobacter westerhofensis]